MSVVIFLKGHKQSEMKKTIVLLIILLLLSSCAPQYIGQYLHPDSSETWFNNKSGHHRVTKKHFIFDYDYTNDEKTNTVNLKGYITCNPKNVTDWEQAEIEVLVLIHDKSRKVSDFKSIMIGDMYDGDSLCEKRYFNLNMSKGSAPRVAVRWGYSANMRQ